MTDAGNLVGAMVEEFEALVTLRTQMALHSRTWALQMAIKAADLQIEQLRKALTWPPDAFEVLKLWNNAKGLRQGLANTLRMVGPSD